jgi:hypothetical protein
MRTTMLGLALLGAAVSASAMAQTSPATPDRNPPAAATQNSTTPAARAPAPNDRSGATAVGPSTESGQAAVRIDDGTRTAATPQSGANSFTEGQARSRIEAAGFTNVTELQKDDQGIWRGRGTREGRQVGVALDFTGNVTSR